MSRTKYFLHVFREESRFLRSHKDTILEILREECSLHVTGIHDVPVHLQYLEDLEQLTKTNAAELTAYYFEVLRT